jgi:hypothetical protein
MPEALAGVRGFDGLVAVGRFIPLLGAGNGAARWRDYVDSWSSPAKPKGRTQERFPHTSTSHS